MTLYSYVVEHDYGYAPNPYWGYCTLCRCKFRKRLTDRRNIVELAQKGDWILGTGGVKLSRSAGRGRLVYAMKVEDKVHLEQYWNCPTFKDKKPSRRGDYARRRGDNEGLQIPPEYALISYQEWYYFGDQAPNMPEEFRALEKRGSYFKRNFPPGLVEQFLCWLKTNQKTGKHGEPCGKAEKEVWELTCKSSC